MSDLEKARWMAMGYKAKQGVKKLDARLTDWSLFSKTFGFFQWCKKHGPTEEQLSLFAEGFRHVKTARR